MVLKYNDIERRLKGIWKGVSKRTQRRVRMTLSYSNQMLGKPLSRFRDEVAWDGLAK